MPAKIELIRKKLLDLDQAVGRLRSWLPITRDRLEQDLMLQWAVERGLQLAAECLFDCGGHILVGEYRESLDEYRQIPVRLMAHGVISPSTEQRLRSLSGFRNLLVHDYADVDMDKLVAGVERLADFEAFVADIERWLGARGTP